MKLNGLKCYLVRAWVAIWPVYYCCCCLLLLLLCCVTRNLEQIYVTFCYCSVRPVGGSADWPTADLFSIGSFRCCGIQMMRYISVKYYTHTHRRGTRDRCFDYSTGPDWLREGATACPNDGRTYRLCVKHTHIRSGCQQGVKAHVPSAHLSGRTTHTIRISNVNRVEFMLNCTLHALLFYRSCIFPCYVIINFMNIFSAVRSASWKLTSTMSTTKLQRNDNENELLYCCVLFGIRR